MSGGRQAGEGLHLPRVAPIDAFGNGGFRFADMSHRGSLLILPDSMRAWNVAEPAQLSAATLAQVFARADDIETLIIGGGAAPFFFPNALREQLRARGVVVDSMQTAPAVKVYNIMMGEGRRVAAGLIAVP